MDKILEVTLHTILLLTAEIPGVPVKSSSPKAVTGTPFWSMGMVVVMPLTDQFDQSVPAMLQL